MISNETEPLNFNFGKPTPTINPSEDLFYAGTVVKTTKLDFERIRNFILTQTNARLIFQTKSEHYLKILPADKTTER